MNNKVLLSSLIIFTLINVGITYKPVVIIHGIMTGSESMRLIEREIKKSHPGTIVYVTDRFSGWSSLENAWHQVLEMGTDLLRICDDHPGGIHLLGYSQGGLIARAILEAFPNHKVNTFISLSSPQAGQFGTDFLHLIFPDLMAKTAFELFYSHVGQHTSVGNYWNDPHKQDLYYQFSVFLPYINNEIKSSNSTLFREGLLNLRKMVLIGGPDDGVITPWQSSHFGYYDENDEVVPMHKRKVYTDDAIGLRTLDKSKKLHIDVVPGVTHMEWHLDVDVIRNHILPHLD